MPDPSTDAVTFLERANIRVFEIVVSLIQVLAVAFIGWLSVTTINQGEAIASMMSNRYTAQDALEQQKADAEGALALWKEVSSIRQDLADKADAANVPSPETLRRMERLQDEVDRLDIEIKEAAKRP
jgi:heme/copper-type cytochrome/quinol oxidase subunit 2